MSVTYGGESRKLLTFSLGIGIIFLLVALVLSRSTPLTPSEEERLQNMPLTVEILGLTPYRVGEEISFDINFEGTGNFCGAPFMQILNEDRSTILWSFNGTDYSKGCNGKYDTYVQRYTFPGQSLPNDPSPPPLIINQTGRYILHIPFEGRDVEQRFTIY